MAAPTDFEKETLIKFRERLGDLKYPKDDENDVYLLRWLRARESNLDEAEKMLRSNLKWREENGADDLKKWEAPAEFYDQLTYDITGFTEDESPITFIPFGTWDFKKIIDAGEREALRKYIILLFERSISEIVKQRIDPKTKLPVTQIVYVVDMSNFAYRQIASISTVGFMLETVTIFESNYPEVLRAGYIINAPWVFSIFFNMMKPLLSARTLGKMEIFSGNEGWKDFLVNNLPTKTIPEHYGGTCAISVLNQRGEKNVPLQSKIEDGIEEETEEENKAFEKMTIASGKKFIREYIVPKAGTKIWWKFKTDDYNIGFSISDGKTDLVKYKRCDSHVRCTSGSVLCPNAGTYSVQFDNSFSMFRAKTLQYFVNLTLPGAE